MAIFLTEMSEMRTKGTLALINISARKQTDWEFGLIVTYATFETLALMG